MSDARSEMLPFRNHALWFIAGALYFALTLSGIPSAHAQDQDDPPGRVARLGHMEGSISFQPAGENEWVEASPNRPLTTGDKLWADRNSRAEVQLGSATIDLAPETGFSFLNLDDRTIQIQLSAGSLSLRVWDLDRDNVVEVDTANQAFTVNRAGRYRIDASENGDYTVVSVRTGEGESTGNGQIYTIHEGQRFTFRGTNTLNAEVDQLRGSDDFDDWSDRRERRYQDSPSARYCSRRVVGFQDLDDYGDWRSTPDYGYAWFPRVEAGWAPYHTGHWAWIDPWGWTWVDEAPWGYAPFHYGRWAFLFGRWGWVPGPVEVRPVYAPALVVFVGGGLAAGGNVGWFPLGPREVYVPGYRVSPAYVNRVNISNTTVNQTTITNVYNTTIVNNNTTINNVTYVNRNVRGAVVAVPQRAFASAQPVSRTAVAVNPAELRSTQVVARAAVPPAPQAVFGPHSNTANRVAAPPPAVQNRAVIAKSAPPPPSSSFSARQQILEQHPGVPVARQEMQRLRPANAAAPLVRQAPPARPATATPAPGMNRPGAAENQPGNPANGRPGTPEPGRPNAQPTPGNPPATSNRPGEPNPPGRNDRPPFNQPNRPGQPAPNSPANNPEMNRPGQPPRNDRPPSAQPNRPQPGQPPANQPAPGNNRPFEPPPGRNDRPPAPAQPDNRPGMNQPAPNNRPDMNPPPSRNDRPDTRPNEPMPNRNDRPPVPNNRPEMNQPAPNNRPDMNPPPSRNDRPDTRPNEPMPNRNDRQPSQPDYRSQPSPARPSQTAPDNRPAPQPDNSRPNNARPDTSRPEPQPRNDRPSPPPRNDRPQGPPQNDRPQAAPPQQQRQAPPPQRPEDRKRQDENKDKDKKPQ